ncbi:MAG: hypothetical protein M1838_002151 [Thelocarpon superellum]|nr:MAG: hypothetical protein M1838_002151 [Thelocarpon superellum]
MAAEYAFVAAPPTASTTTLTSARRRHRDLQPPALSTTLNALHRLGTHLTGQAPPSATSTSPYSSNYNPASFAASPSSVSSQQGHLGSRASGGSYNPQQWMPGRVNPGAAPAAAPATTAPGHIPYATLSNSASRASSATREQAPALSPPPPYSPRRNQNNAASNEGTPLSSQTASTGSMSSHFDTPVSAATTISAGPSPASHSNHRHTVSTQHVPPPPPAAERRAHSTSRAGLDPIHPVHMTMSGMTMSPDQMQVDVGDLTRPQAWSDDRASTYGGALSIVTNLDDPVRPPAARRAASTGAIEITYAPHALRDQTFSTSRAWEPGMPLPPPPPGPPPTTRSQSMSRTQEPMARDFNPSAPPPSAPRRTAATGSRLPPVPPTPLDWVESDPMPRVPSYHGVTPYDATAASPLTTPPTVPGRPREPSVKGIRERRSESRSGKGRLPESTMTIETDNNPWRTSVALDPSAQPAILPLESPTLLRRRRTVTKSTPRTSRGGNMSTMQPTSGGSVESGEPLDSASSRRTTPRPGSARQMRGPDALAPTPPFSPGFPSQDTSPRVPPKSLPTPPPHSGSTVEGLPARTEQPLSPGLPAPSTDAATAPPLTSARPSSGSSVHSQMLDSFGRSAVDRHRLFAEREATAQSNHERIQLFAEFIVAESRIRRERYSDAIDAMGSEILELTRDLFRPYPKSSVASPASASSGAEWSSHRGSLNSAMQESFSPVESPKTRGDSTWAGVYMPSLSPIPSMSVSEVMDELSSRGRPASRWWEASQDGSLRSGGSHAGIERSKRESKYMGLPLRDWGMPSSSQPPAVTPNEQTLEFPPEKVGWHEEATPQSSDPKMLDVSRLVTMPPPYPRHYPAVNNNHPDLSSLRATVRGLTNLEEVEQIKDVFMVEIAQMAEETTQRRSVMQEDIRRQIDAGSMSYADAARLEETAEQGERGRHKQVFERFEAEVMKPLHKMLKERIKLATESFDELTGQLTEPNPVEEGDAKPELLEKLTLLKWLFEAREQVHREEFDLLSERNAHYKAMVMAPYDNAQKIAEVEAFFARDVHDRRQAFEQEALTRYDRFMDLVEENVTRGVEVQLSSFWDIAPSLVEVMARVNVERGVQTDGERTYAFSQQYLWEVVCHAEKSTYQFIEGQVNLLCLLHEVKSGVAKQRRRVTTVTTPTALPRPRSQTGSTTSSPRRGGESTTPTKLDGALLQREQEAAEQARARAIEEEKAHEQLLTHDLQEKVATVEKQWREAMGDTVGALKKDVKLWLGVREGGLDGLEEG